VAWIVEGTDDTKVPADFTFVQSGSVGQTYTGTALTAGTCGTIRCTVHGGIDPATDASSSTMVARGKFFTPTNWGSEVLTVAEQDDDNYLSDPTHGMIKPVNENIRGSAVLSEFNGQCAGGGTLVTLSYTVPTDTRLYVESTALATDTVTGDGACYVNMAAWKNIAGAVTLIGASAPLVAEDDAAWGLFASAVATEATVTFTGDAVNATDIVVSYRTLVKDDS
jgi:hypothetical protein